MREATMRIQVLMHILIALVVGTFLTLAALALMVRAATADTTAYCVQADEIAGGGLWCADELSRLPGYLVPNATVRSLNGLGDYPRYTKVEVLNPRRHVWCDVKRHPRIPLLGEIIITSDGPRMRLQAGKKALTWDMEGLRPCTRY